MNCPIMFYETSTNAHGLPHDPFKAIVTPRPIGWITAMSTKGEINLSPYSFFNAISERPPMVAFASAGKKDALLHRGDGGVRLQSGHLRPSATDERHLGGS